MRKEEIRAILQTPRELLKDMEEINLRIGEYNNSILMSPVFSFAPVRQTGTYCDLSDRAVHLEELANTKAEMEADYSVACDRAKDLIALIENPMVHETLYRFYINGQELREIAELSGKGYHAVYQQIRRALMRLSEMEG